MYYFQGDSTAWTELEGGMRRKLVGHTPQLMSVLMQFDKGAVGTPHAHDIHDQIAFVVAGAFEVVVKMINHARNKGLGPKSSENWADSMK